MLARTLALCVAAGALALPALADETDAHLKTVRDRRLTAHDKAPALEAILAGDISGVERLAPTLAKEIERLGRDFLRQRSRLVKGMGAAAYRQVRSRLNPRVMAEVEQLQEKVLGIARGEGLTEEKIRQESDPAVARLRELLLIAPDQVLDQDEDLEDLSLEVWGLVDEAQLLWGYWEKTAAALEQSDDRARRSLERVGEVWNPSGMGDALLKDLRFQCELATPMSSYDRKLILKNAELAAEIPESEAEGNRLLNELRIILGLPAVLTDVKLCEAARGHSKDMAEHGFFSHTSPIEGKETVGKRAALAGTSGGAENIARGQGSAQGAINAWWYSPGHHRNMLGGHGRVGLGRHESHWTQMFG